MLVYCVLCPDDADAVTPRFTYYAVLIVVFQLGWASVQVAHLAMIPEMVCQPEKDTVELNAIRSDILFYSLAMFLRQNFQLGPPPIL